MSSNYRSLSNSFIASTKELSESYQNTLALPLILKWSYVVTLTDVESVYIIARGIRHTATLLSCLHAIYKLSLSQKKLKRKKPPPLDNQRKELLLLLVFIFRIISLLEEARFYLLRHLPCPLLLKSSQQIKYGLLILNISNQFFTTQVVRFLH